MHTELVGLDLAVDQGGRLLKNCCLRSQMNMQVIDDSKFEAIYMLRWPEEEEYDKLRQPTKLIVKTTCV